ncbi:autotransporter assembly complex family protein [Marinobacteraceae bacterium S3BR75-40.1]
MPVNVRHLVAVLFWLFPLSALAQQVDVRVHGEAPGLRENIDAHLNKVEGRDKAGLRRYASYAREEARRAAEALGYYQARVETRIKDGDPPILLVTVTPGTPVHVRGVSLRIEGPASELEAFDIPGKLRPQPGDRLDHGAYQKLKDRIQNLALRYGFFDGHFKRHRLYVDANNGYADITLIYQSGPRYRLGKVHFPEQLALSDELLRRFVRFEPGTPYDADKIARLNQDLRNSGYFREILVDASPEQAKDRVIPVDVSLTMRKPHDLGVGVGFSTDVGPRTRLSWTEHWVNDAGLRRGADLEVSRPRQNIQGWYEMPLDPPVTDSMRFTGGYQREDIEDTKSKLLTLGVQWQHQMPSEWQEVVSLKWHDERFNLGGDTGRTSLLLPGLSFSKLHSDQSIDPSRGYRLQLDITGASKEVLSDANLLRGTVLAKGLTTVGAGHRFLARLQVGGLAANDFSLIPPTLRFFAGGDQSVRGYGYRTLAPTDEDGDLVGGRYLFESSFEYQYPLSQHWRLAFFVDHGNAFDSLSEPLKTGVGTGIRWVSPVGPLRLDLARAMDDGSFRLHFSMGPEL